MKYLLLSLLHEPLTLPELLSIIKSNRIYVNKELHILLKKGYIDRVGTRRNYRYYITPKGLLKYYYMKIGRILGRYNND